MHEADLFLGLDLGGSELKAVVMRKDGSILWERRIPTRPGDGREAVLGRLGALISGARTAVPGRPIRGIGVAVPAVLDMDAGTIELLPNFTPEWTDFRLKDELERQHGLPVTLLNDVRAATIAEHLWGAGRGYQNLICIALGTGVGGGLILDGRLYLGSRGAAGEIGHQTAIPDGERCGCGNYGCLETVAGGPAISRAARQAIEAGDGELARLAGTREPSPAEVSLAARKGSEGARTIFDRAGRIVGRMLANLICVLNPEAVVVGGGLAEAGELLLAPMRAEIERRTVVFAPERGQVVVLASPLQNRAGAMGSACWAWQHVPEAAAP